MAAPGDIERDFWLAYDLLQNPKDHAEFTIVRNWVQEALKVTNLSRFRKRQFFLYPTWKLFMAEVPGVH